MPKRFVGELFRLSLISGIETFYAEEGYVTIFRRVFLSRSTEKFCRGTLLYYVSEKFPVANKFMDKKGGVSRFSVEILCLTAPKIFVGEHFRLSLFSGIEKFFAEDGYVMIFCRFSLSRSTEIFCRGTLLCCVLENF